MQQISLENIHTIQRWKLKKLWKPVDITDKKMPTLIIGDALTSDTAFFSTWRLRFFCVIFNSLAATLFSKMTTFNCHVLKYFSASKH